MINLGAIVLVPMAVIISDVMGGTGSYYDEVKQAWLNFSSCLFGVILASLIGFVCDRQCAAWGGGSPAILAGRRT